MANDAGTAYVDVEPDLKGFGSKLSRGIDPHVDKSAKNVESKFGGAFKGVAAVAGGAFAAIGAASALKGIISGASDLNETISKSNTIFGDNAKEIEAWAGGAAKSMGQSKQGALDAAATFGNLFVQLGTGSGEAAKMSKEMVGLASDFASFHNADPTDVIEAMTAAFRGEYDAVQRYVPTINAAAVEQEALKMGLAKTTKELTAQDKALATQALLMSGAGAAIGDFARTSDGLANKQRILAAQFQDMKDKVGTALLPVVLKLMEAFLKLGAALSGPLKSAFAGITSAWDAVVGGFQNPNATFGKSVGLMESIFLRAGQVVREVTGGVRAFFAAFKAGDGDVTSAGFAGVMERIGLAVRSVVDWVKTNWPAVQATIAEFVSWAVSSLVPKIQEVAAFFIQKFGEIIAWVRTNWPAISEAVGHVVAVVQELIERLAPIVRRVWEEMQTKIEVTIAVIKAVIETALNVINGNWSAIWNSIKDFFAGIWDSIFQVARDGVAKVVDVFLGMVEKIIGAADAAFGWIPGIGGKLEDAKAAFASFRDQVNASIRGIDSEKTITINVVEAVSRENNTNLGTAGDPIAPPAGSEDNSTEALPDRAHGMDEGPLPGPRGKPLLVRAHGGEWVLTPEQFDALRSGRSGGTSAPAAGGVGFDYDRLAEAMSRVQLSVAVSSVAKGLHDSRRL